MTKRLLILQIVLLAGMSGVFLIPTVQNTQPIGIEMSLPEGVGEWSGEEALVTDREKEVLGPETTFARKLYRNGRGDELFVSIVLSGEDMNTSIHRPERCLPAQGWTIVDERQVMIPIGQGGQENQGGIPVMRLHNVRSAQSNAGKEVSIYGLDYYWFVGYNDMTASHWVRTMIDIRDRLMHGYNQRWAYVTVTGTITKGLQPFGRSDQEVDELIREFIRQLGPKILRGSVKYG